MVDLDGIARHRIVFTRQGKADLAYFSAYERKRILDAVRRQLCEEPLVETRNRKALRENPVGRWELRIGKYRVFYDVEEPVPTVVVGAVGCKVHNVLYIRGEEISL